MPGMTKPSVVAHKAKIAIRGGLGMQVPADPRRGYTDRVEALSPAVYIAYEKNHAPSDAVRTTVLAGAKLAMTVIRKANDAMASVVILRQKEPAWFTQTMATHFNLVAGDTAGGFLTDNTVDKKFSMGAVLKHDRRWVLEKIRQRMLDLSFHLNTGLYLIDGGETHRDIAGGADTIPATAPSGTEAYVVKPKTQSDKAAGRTTEWKHVVDQHGNKEYRLAKGLGCGFKNGEIHVEFDNLLNYSALSYARIIIHEAVHKYLGVDDIYYAHDANYPGLGLDRKLENADSYAWTAVSLYSKAPKMTYPGLNPDWDNCT